MSQLATTRRAAAATVVVLAMNACDDGTLPPRGDMRGEPPPPALEHVTAGPASSSPAPASNAPAPTPAPTPTTTPTAPTPTRVDPREQLASRWTGGTSLGSIDASLTGRVAGEQLGIGLAPLAGGGRLEAVDPDARTRERLGSRGRTGWGTHGKPVVHGELDPIVVRRHLGLHTSHFQRCYALRPTSRSTLAGTTSLEFRIAATGQVESASASGLDAEVDACIASALRSLVFPKPKAGTVEVVTTITFEPGSLK